MLCWNIANNLDLIVTYHCSELGRARARPRARARSDRSLSKVQYIYTEGNLNDSSKFWAFLHRKFSKEVEEKVMTLGQQAIQQALQQGVQQGVQQESRETALRMLDEKFDIKTISKITKLSPGEVKQLAKQKN